MDLADVEIESLKKVVLAEQNSYLTFCNPYEKVGDSIFFKLIHLENFSRYATEYAYKNHLLKRKIRNQMHSKWERSYKMQFFEDRRLYNLSMQWNAIEDSYFKYPKVIWIGLLNTCNANCLFCCWFSFSLSKTLRNDYFKTNQKIATTQVESILQYAGLAKAKCIFSGPGEPLLDERLEGFVQLAKEFGVKSIQIATNGILLTPQKFLELVEAGVDSWIISVYFTKETYAQCEEGFFEIFKNRLIEIAKIVKQLNLALSLHLAIVYEEHRLLEMLEFWNEIVSLSHCIKVSVICYAENNGEYIDQDLTKEIRAKQLRHTCSAPFSSLYVFPSGDVGHCEMQRGLLGREDAQKFCIGNVYQQDLAQIWNGVAHKRFCQAHKAMDFTQQQTAPCSSCNAWWNELEG